MVKVPVMVRLQFEVPVDPAVEHPENWLESLSLVQLQKLVLETVANQDFIDSISLSSSSNDMELLALDLEEDVGR